MRLSERLWSVLLVGVLVVGLLVGFGDGDEAVAKEPRATLGKIMVPAAAFIPAYDVTGYSNLGVYLTASNITGYAEQFLAPVWFPVPEVYLRKIMLIAYDNEGGIDKRVCVYLHRAQPLNANGPPAGAVCTADSTDDPQKVVTTAISPRRVNTVNHGVYLWAVMHPDTNLYGVQVVYSY